MADKIKDLELQASCREMNDQVKRLKTFKDWPFTDDCHCTAEKMAEAGFYHTPSDNEPDLVTCYVCYKELDGWEPTDDPWVEHKNHSKNCPFISIRKKQNEWTVEDTINMEIKRFELRNKKAVEALVGTIEDKEQVILSGLNAILEESYQ